MGDLVLAFSPPEGGGSRHGLMVCGVGGRFRVRTPTRNHVLRRVGRGAARPSKP